MNLYDHFERTSQKTKIIPTLVIQLQQYLDSSLITFLKNSAIKQHLITNHNNSTEQITSSYVRKNLTDNTIIIYKNNNNNKQFQILEAICIKNKTKKNMNKIAFSTVLNILIIKITNLTRKLIQQNIYLLKTF